jgi:hypothetical protein
MVIISAEFKYQIDQLVKTDSKKEKIYDFIDTAKKVITVDDRDDKQSLDYRFKDVVKNYQFSGPDTYKDYNFETLLKKEIFDNVSNIIKAVKGADFVTYFDKTIVEKYVTHFLGCKKPSYSYEDDCKEYAREEAKLSNRIGEAKFNEWVNENGPAKVVLAVSALVDEAVAKYDTHRYSDEVVQCFVDAANVSDFKGAASDCQYIHKIGLDALGQEL